MAQEPLHVMAAAATRIAKAAPWLVAATVASIGLLGLALIWDWLPIDRADWPGASARGAERAEREDHAQRRARAWSRTLADGLTCGGDLAVKLRLADKLQDKAPETCQRLAPLLAQVWLLPATDGPARRAIPGPGPATLERPAPRTRERIHEAVENEVETYAVAPGDGTGIDQFVPIRSGKGRALLLRFLPGAGAPAGSEPIRVLDDLDAAPGFPIQQARGLRVAMAEGSERQWLASLALGLVLLGISATLTHFHGQRRHRRDLQELQDASPVGMLVTDRDGRIVSANPAFCDLVRAKREEIEGSAPPYSFWSESAAATTRGALETLFKERSDDVSYPARYTRSDNNIRLVRVRATALRDGRGWLLTSQDMTDDEDRRERLERLGRELLDRREADLEHLDAFTMVHDLWLTQASTIDQTALNLSRRMPEPLLDLVRSDLETIRELADLMKTKMFEFLRQVKGEPLRELCDPKGIVDEAFELVSHQARQSGARLANLVFPGFAPRMLAHHTLLHVLVNLISNALHSMDALPEDGRLVSVESSVLPPSSDGIRRLRLRVIDRGCGIPDGQKERIFESGVAFREGGSGLGLTRARARMRRIDGDIGVESTTSIGTTMYLEFPFDPPSGNSP